MKLALTCQTCDAKYYKLPDDRIIDVYPCSYYRRTKIAIKDYEGFS